MAETVDPRLVAALARQHSSRAALLMTGAAHVGWKIGIGDRERIAGQVVIGYLTSATLYADGQTILDSMGEPKAEVELAVELGSHVEPNDDDSAILAAIRTFRTALEVCDTARPRSDDAPLIVEENVFHHGLALGAGSPTRPDGKASIQINGIVVETASTERELAGLLRWTARLLQCLGERLSPGDVVITGGILHVPIRRGDHITAVLEGLDPVSLALA
jgi:2-keto-4-pentenoate hydratase